jgi:hypothetical protein
MRICEIDLYGGVQPPQLRNRANMAEPGRLCYEKLTQRGTSVSRVRSRLGEPALAKFS